MAPLTTGCKPLPDDFSPSPEDVICGRSREFFHHDGNAFFRKLIDDCLPRYIRARTKFDKSETIAMIVDIVESKSPGGGFVRKDIASGKWHRLGEAPARDKVGHAIRKALRDMKDAGEAQGGSQAASSTIQHRLIKQQEGKAAIAKRNLAVGGQKHHHGTRNGSVAVAPDGVKRQGSVAMAANRNAAAGVDEEDGSAEGSEQRQTVTGVAQHRLRAGPPLARFPPASASRMVSSSSSPPPPPPLHSSSSTSSLQQRSREQLLLSAILRQENEARLLAALQLQRSMARQGQVPLDGSAGASFLQQTEQAPVSQASLPLALQRYLAGTLAGTGRRGEQQQLRSPNHEGDHADGLIAAAVAARREASMMSSLSALRERLVLEKIFELEQQQRSDDALLASYLKGLGSRGHPQHGGDHDRAQLASLLLLQQQQQKQRQLSSSLASSSSQSALIRSLATGRVEDEEDTAGNSSIMIQGELSQPDPVGSVLIRDRLARTNLGMIDKLRQIAPRTVLESSSASAGSASIPSRVQSSTHAAVNPNVASSPSS